MTGAPSLSRANRRPGKTGYRTAIPAGLLLALALLSTPSVTAAADPSITGLWLTDDGKAVIRIAPCGAQLCGHIAQVLERGPDIPKTDVNNPNARGRNVPLVGLRTLWGMSRTGPAWKGGSAYDPKSSKTYRASLALNADGSLKVTGCVLIICQSRRWTRAR